jgi:hypothetical protein
MQFIPLPIRLSMRAATERCFRLGRGLTEQMRLGLHLAGLGQLRSHRRSSSSTNPCSELRRRRRHDKGKLSGTRVRNGRDTLRKPNR